MHEESESVHVHCIDERAVIKDYTSRGFVLKARTAPTIIAQMGFVKLIFVRKVEDAKTVNTGAYLG